MRTISSLTWIVFLACCIGGSELSANTILSTATTYNVFVFGNYTGSNADIQGGLAAGGTATLTSYSVGGTTKTSDFSGTGSYSVIAATNLLLSGGSITGNAYDGTAGGLSSYNITGTVTSGGSASSSPIDFSAAATELKSLSASLASTQTTSADSCTLVYSTVVCTASQSGVNIINVTDKLLTSGSGIEFHSTYADATIILNVTGTNATIGGGGWSFYNTSSSYVLLNFVNATSLTISGSLSASILAPLADVTGTGSAVNGNLIANSYSGTTQFNSVLFTGVVPANPAVPEPVSFLLAGAGLLAIGWLRRR
jgi:choice-of-anchor A domain-containing protein